MDAGRLDQRIELQEALSVSNTLNEDVLTWVPMAKVWARQMETAGREFLKAGGLNAETKAVFVIRWRADVDSALRVDWRGRIFEIEDVTGTQREGFLYLHCRSVAGVN